MKTKSGTSNVAATSGRNWVAVAAHQRTSAGPMGKRGAGRSKRDPRPRTEVRRGLKNGSYGD